MDWLKQKLPAGSKNTLHSTLYLTQYIFCACVIMMIVWNCWGFFVVFIFLIQSLIWVKRRILDINLVRMVLAHYLQHYQEGVSSKNSILMKFYVFCYILLYLMASLSLNWYLSVFSLRILYNICRKNVFVWWVFLITAPNLFLPRISGGFCCLSS